VIRELTHIELVMPTIILVETQWDRTNLTFSSL